jgi:hypothetical protein
MAGLDPATHALRRSERKVEGPDTVSIVAIVAIVGSTRSTTT